jgi:pimeloyl-ACP methyl ester carboxylesterase
MLPRTGLVRPQLLTNLGVVIALILPAHIWIQGFEQAFQHSSNFSAEFDKPVSVCFFTMLLMKTNRSDPMIYYKLFGLALVLVALASCTSQAPIEVLPEISRLQRVWQDESGQLYSAIRAENGEFIIHNPATGEFFNYWREFEDGPLQSHPSHAPLLSYENQTLKLGETSLKSANVQARQVSFENEGAMFTGVLIVPEYVSAPVPVIVNSHGSERSGAIASDWAASWYTQHGFASFIFDKRGTGTSGGEYTHNFELLASDLNAAISAVSSQPDIDETLIGVGGYSQGVYVGTLAASRNPAIKFMIASYGVMEPPIMEDFLETKRHFTANYPLEDWEEFSPLVEACEAAFALGDKSRWDEVVSYKRMWRDRINPDHLAGTLTGDGCLRWPPFALRLVGDSQFPPGLNWGFDPSALMVHFEIPVLFQYGEADVDAPLETSVVKVQQWIDSGKPFSLYTYPDAEHGMYLSAIDAEGNSYRYKAPKYIADLLAWLDDVRESAASANSIGSR